MRAVASLLFAALLSCPAGDIPFLRGMGWSPWHATYGWGRPPEVVAQDYRFLADMHVNALRTWGPTKRASLEKQFEAHGLYMVPQVGGIKAPRMAFADGKSGHVVYAHPDSLEAMRERATALAKDMAGARGLAALNLGNEYSWVGTNKKGHYQYQGFDKTTLTAFRRMLEKRFGTIANWQRLTGRKDKSFADIIPPTGQNNSLLFWEWWRFQREVFGQYLRVGHEAVRAVAPDTPVTYALLCGNRWDAATEDADLPFLELQGDNLYYNWDKNWVDYSVRLARRIGPGRPALITETGINTQHCPDPAVAERLMRQMLWTLLMHTEVKGVFPFVYCDEWWHGKDPKAQDSSGDYWGILTADRKPKSTYQAVKQTYAEWERLGEIIDTRESEIELLVSDQVIDRWRGRSGPTVKQVCRQLYTHGVSFRLVSALRPSDLAATLCKRLLLLDSHLPDNPGGTSPMRDALRDFVAKGGEILCLSEKPFQALYGTPGPHGIKASVRTVDTPEAAWSQIQPFLPQRSLKVTAKGEILWREFRAGDRRFVLLVASGSEPARNVRLESPTGLSLVSSDARELSSVIGGWTIAELPTHALFEIGVE